MTLVIESHGFRANSPERLGQRHPALSKPGDSMKTKIIALILFMSLALRAAETRVVENADTGWRFHLGDVPAASSVTFDDSAWRKLDVPHDWSIEGDYSATNPSGDRGGYLPGGIGWYRRGIEMPDAWTNRQVTVEFEGVYMNSEVWLNGERVGGRPYGYSTFYCDLTGKLKPDHNQLAVRVDDSLEPSTRWYHGCGIYGHVHLMVTDPVRVAPNGVYVTTPTITPANATVQVQTRVAHPDRNTASASLCTTLLDADGNVVATDDAAGQRLDNTNPAVFNQTLHVKSPQLWSPDSPVLYTTVSEVVVRGKPVDTVYTTFGIRSLRFDANKGFLLNGQTVKLKGVCDHQGGSPVGAAMPVALLKRRLQQLKDMGCNAIRTSHNPQLPAFYDLCDRMGFLVMDEVFDGWHKKAKEDYGGRFFDGWWKRDVADWVERDRNHPCVIFWSIGNETGKRDTDGITPFIHALDPTRPTTGGSVIYGVDVAGFNGGIVPNFKTLVDYHSAHPTRPIVLTEEPHTFQTRGFYRTVNSIAKSFQPPLPDYARPEIFSGGAAAYRSSYDNCGRRTVIRNSWQMTVTHPWLMGEFRWTGFDYLGEAAWSGREQLAREFNFGVLDLAGFPKDDYCLYQSLWTEKPMVHLLPDWTWPGLEGKTIPVVAYANADEIELLQDGKSLGRQKRSALYECVWQVPYHPGVLKAVAYRGGKAVAEITERTAGAPAKLELTTDNANLQADRNDLALVTVKVCDAQGVFAAHADNRIDLALLGPARWLGGENGDPVDITPQRETSRKVFNGLLRGFYAGKDGVAGPVEVGALGILGNSTFKQSAQVTIAWERVALRGKLAGETTEIHYTTDGSAPALTSPAYKKSFAVTSTRTVRAAAFRDGKVLASSRAIFTRGGPNVGQTSDAPAGDMGDAEDPIESSSATGK